MSRHGIRRVPPRRRLCLLGSGVEGWPSEASHFSAHQFSHLPPLTRVEARLKHGARGDSRLEEHGHIQGLGRGAEGAWQEMSALRLEGCAG